jgi:hypothetical protein
MSSTELASQEQQLSIKQAEQEALAHSILIKSNVPRAKITHKGLQDIEDVNEDSAVAKQRRERELEMAEEERERERLARLRTVQPHSNPPSASVPPESPVVASASSASAPWNTTAPQGQGTEAHAGAAAVDSELNLGDFIHMDDEPPEASPLTITTTSTTATNTVAAAPSATAISEPLSATTTLTPITGISPFAPSKPDMPPRASFDLNALWSAPAPPPAPMPSSEEQDGDAKEKEEEKEEAVRGGGEGEPMEMDLGTPTDEPAVSASASAASTSVAVAVASGEPEREVEQEGESDDLDFAMFLGQEEEEGKGKSARPEASIPDPQAVFDGLPRVWNGVVRTLSISSLTRARMLIGVGGRRLACRSTRPYRRNSVWMRARLAGGLSPRTRRSGALCYLSSTSGSTVASRSEAQLSTCLLRGSTPLRSSSRSRGHPSRTPIWPRSRLSRHSSSTKSTSRAPSSRLIFHTDRLYWIQSSWVDIPLGIERP